MKPATQVRRVSAQRGVEYEILKCEDVLDPQDRSLLDGGPLKDARRFVVVDETVHRLHAERIERYFELNRVEARIVPCPAGEANKSADRYAALASELDAFPVHRRDEPIIVIGGGVLTDLVGFLAGTYRRGIPHINVPTTLMGHVDAALGVKTAINFGQHKNRIGAFVPPQKVLLDRTFLASLPERHVLNGVCEMIKLAVIADAPLFRLLEQHARGCIGARFQDDAGALILDRAVQRMIEELEPNLYEDTLARSMDFGHTFSYGIETAPEAEWLHGEAVLMDVVLSCRLAARRGLLAADQLERLLQLLERLGMTAHLAALDPAQLWESLTERTLHRNRHQWVPLPTGIGSYTFVDDVTSYELAAVCSEASLVSSA